MVGFAKCAETNTVPVPANSRQVTPGTTICGRIQVGRGCSCEVRRHGEALASLTLISKQLWKNTGSPMSLLAPATNAPARGYNALSDKGEFTAMFADSGSNGAAFVVGLNAC